MRLILICVIVSCLTRCFALNPCCADENDWYCLHGETRWNPNCNYDGCANVIGYNWYTGGDELQAYSCMSRMCYNITNVDRMFGISNLAQCPEAPAACPPGKYSLNGVCIACTANNYCIGDGNLPRACSTTCSGTQKKTGSCSTTADIGCVNCPSNAITSPTDITTCVCMAGFKQTATGPVCSACPAGQQSNADNSACTACAPGYYSLGGQQ